MINDRVMFSEIGKVSNEFWKDIPKHFPHIKLHDYIVMLIIYMGF